MLPSDAGRPFIAALVVWVATLSIGAAQPRPAAEALARSLQQRYQGIKDFSADFVHN